MQLEIKAQIEEYARQRAEEQAILKAAREARKQQEKAVHRLTADEAAKIQERVCCILKRVVSLEGSYLCLGVRSLIHLLLNFNLLFMFQSQKMLEEKQARKKEKEVEKMEKEKRLQKLKSQVFILQFSSIYKTRRFPSYFTSVGYCREEIKHFF